MTFRIEKEFEDFLNDPGASFRHPRKSELTLKDIFVFPDMRKLRMTETRDKLLLSDIFNSENLFKVQKDKNRILIIGDEKSGKTTLCRILYKHYHQIGFIPVYIEGHTINTSSIEKFNGLVKRCFLEQYSDDKNIDKFVQAENVEKLLIIDNFQKSRLNLKHKNSLLKEINQHYPNVLITANELFQIEEIVYKKKEEDSVLKEYQQFVILELGNYLRTKLIEKWNIIGREEFIEDNELIRRNDQAKIVIDVVIGKNFVPAYPLFLLAILQSIEIAIPHNLTESSYGYYYEFLIIQALAKIDQRNEEIETYINYLAELANSVFENKMSLLSIEKFREFHSWYCKEYSISPSHDVYIDNLTTASMIQKKDGGFRFKYPYVYYFFVAKYLSNNIASKVIKQRIQDMCKRLYREEFANIIMFLTHLSKDPAILNEILDNARSVFSELKPVQFEQDISIINSLMDEMPKFVLEDKDVNKFREGLLKRKDEIELPEKLKDDVVIDEEYDLKEEIPTLDMISNLNLSFKMIEILGQILKNYYGSLKTKTKYSLGEEAYFLGLRSLNVFFSILVDNVDFLVSQIRSIIEEKRMADKLRIEQTSKKVLFGICYLVSYGFIKKIAGCLGSEKLAQTFNQIVKQNNTTAVRLIDLSIKLDYFRDFPYEDINKFKKRTIGNILPLTVLKRMVVNYLYMFPTDYKAKQRICNSLDIPMASQRLIEQRSTQRKRD